MSSKFSVLGAVLVGVISITAAAQDVCPPRPVPGTAVANPLELKSQNGVLNVDLDLRSQPGENGSIHYCYVYMQNNTPVEAPTLRLNPGDRLVLNFSNNISVTDRLRPLKSRHAPIKPMIMGDMQAAINNNDPCQGGMLMATSTNIHFHGLNVPPVCHQDEVVKTIIQNDGQPFQYSVQIPANDPPGLYWYHPHPHGFATPQINGGASGALVIEGSNSLTQGLPERVLVIRDNPEMIVDEDGQFTVNQQIANYPRRALPVINMQSNQKEFWRVLNSTTKGFLTLQVYAPQLQNLQLISLDGIPLTNPIMTTTITLPPAGRAEFIVPPLPANANAFFQTNGYNTGPGGDPMGVQRLAKLAVTNANLNLPRVPNAPPPTRAQRFSSLNLMKPTTTRSLYFSELNLGSNGPTQFFITVDGAQPRVFDPMNPPAVKTKVGAVEDWTIENRTAESHAFHMHQIHFLVLAVNGQPLPNPPLVDTVTVDNWTGHGPYPSVTLRMDFRDPEIAGKSLYHCHILDHEDGGMMATIDVAP